MSSNTIIPAESAEGWSRWQLDELDGRGTLFRPSNLAQRLLDGDVPDDAPEQPDEGAPVDPEPDADAAVPPAAYPTAAELEAIHQEAWQAGFDAGHAEGLAAGRAEGAQQALAEAQQRFEAYWQPLSGLSDALEAQLAEVERGLADSLLRLALELGQGLAGTQLSARPEVLRQLVEEALAEVKGELSQLSIRCHPDDVEVLQAFLAERFATTRFAWLADEAVERGGCLIDAPSCHVDLSLASRRAAIRRALGLDHET